MLCSGLNKSRRFYAAVCIRVNCWFSLIFNRPASHSRLHVFGRPTGAGPAASVAGISAQDDGYKVLRKRLDADTQILQ